MNIGPQPDGSLSAASLDRLKGVGKWMDEFGYTVYGTRGGVPDAVDYNVELTVK